MTLSALLLLALAAQGSADEPLPRVLVLGTYHMANPGLDLLNPVADDVLAERRQEEIELLVERVLRFEPTRVAVEVTPDRQAALDGRYRAYLEGRLAPERDEVYQVAFRVAEALGHERLYAVDHRQDLQLGEILERARRDHPALAARLDASMQETKVLLDGLMQQSVVEIVRAMNGPDAAREHGPYLLMAQVGSAEDPVGADGVAAWYERNLKIFANVARLAGSPDDRILVLIGAGHGPLLREFVRQAPNLELAETSAYLAD